MDSKTIHRYFTIAGVRVCISGSRDCLFEDAGLLAPFETEEGPADHELYCEVTETFAQPEGTLMYSDSERRVYCKDGVYTSCIGHPDAPYIRVERKGKTHFARFSKGALGGKISAKAALTALEVENMISQENGLLLHAAWIAHDNGAILFTAPSGTGKSTQAELWRQHRGAEVINGDRAMIRFTKDGAHAVGIPFCGSSRISKNCCLPIRAVVYLSQAPHNRISSLEGVTAFRRIWEGCSVHTWNREDVAKAVDGVQKLISTVPVYHLECRPEEGAVSALEAVLYP